MQPLPEQAPPPSNRHQRKIIVHPEQSGRHNPQAHSSPVSRTGRDNIRTMHVPQMPETSIIFIYFHGTGFNYRNGSVTDVLKMANSVRDHMPLWEKMLKFRGAIDNLLYSAEVNCPVKNRENVIIIGSIEDLAACKGCPWQYFFDDLGIEPDENLFECRLIYLRRWLGEYVKQDDIPEVPLST